MNYLTNMTQQLKDYLFVTRLDHDKPVECYICGISSFDHLHKAGTKPKDFIRVDNEVTPDQQLKEWDEIEKRKKLYKKWSNMNARCYDSRRPGYKNYGGRGIKVCKRWHSFDLFFKDMSPTYQEGLTLDRINHNGIYKPSNCRWATWREQNNNRRDNHVRRKCPLCPEIKKLHAKGFNPNQIGRMLGRHGMTIRYHLEDHPNHLDYRYSLLQRKSEE